MASDDEAATVLRGVAYLLRSGIDPERALAIAAGDASPATAAALTATRKRVQSGRALPEALADGGLVAGHELPRLQAATEMGAPENALDAFAAERVQRRHARREIGQGLIYPGAILLVALVALPLPAVARGELTIGGYVVNLLAQLALIGVVVKAAFRWAAPGARYARELALKTRGCPTLAERERLCRELGELLGSGLSAERVLAAPVRSGQGETARRLAQARRSVVSRGFVAALVDAGLLDASRDRPALEAAEHAGRLSSGLTHHAELLGGDVALRRAMIAEWLPRFAYFAVIAWVLGALVGGGGALVVGA